MPAKSLVDILEAFVNKSKDYTSEIKAIDRYFMKYVESNDSKTINGIIDDDGDDLEITNEADKILKITFKMAWKILLENLSRGSSENKAEALYAATNLLQYHARLKKSVTKYYFPCHMLEELLRQMLHSQSDNRALIAKFKKYTCYNDVLFYCWKSLPKILQDHSKPTDVYVNNVFSFINIAPLKQDRKRKLDAEETEKPELFCRVGEKARFKFDLNVVKKSMEQCWKTIVTWNLRGTQHQQSILLLIDHLIPHLPNPVLLTDFLMNSMDCGGVISTLALQGVFVLMQKHNLEYPQVYNKLYHLYQPDLFFTKHKSRLLFLTDTFLSSTHLPESLVAAFVKKFARLSLLVPSADAIVLLQLISNLIVRHPGLKVMLNAKSSSNSELVDDPYDIEERDPSSSKAIQSSLWEVADLKNHAHPCVAAAAGNALNSHLATMEKPIGDLLDNTEETLIEAEFNRKYKHVYLAAKAPSSGQSIFSQYWQLF